MELEKRLMLFQEKTDALLGPSNGDLARIASKKPSGTAAKIIFHNYKPKNENIIAKADDEILQGKDDPKKISDIDDVDIMYTRGEDVLAKELEGMDDGEGEIQLGPKHPNWDLKAPIEERLAKLNRRTQRAIVDILRGKLAMEVAE